MPMLTYVLSSLVVPLFASSYAPRFWNNHVFQHGRRTAAPFFHTHTTKTASLDIDVHLSFPRLHVSVSAQKYTGEEAHPLLLDFRGCHSCCLLSHSVPLDEVLSKLAWNPDHRRLMAEYQTKSKKCSAHTSRSFLLIPLSALRSLSDTMYRI